MPARMARAILWRLHSVFSRSHHGSLTPKALKWGIQRTDWLIPALFIYSCASTSAGADITTMLERSIQSRSSFVVDVTNSSVILSKRSDVAVPIASITKLMTALVVLEHGQPLDEQIEITADDRITGKGALSRLKVGTRLTRGELLRLALMSSENLAANVLARRYPGSLRGFVYAMNIKASQLGMKATRFADATGLSSKNVATAEDLAKLVTAASRDSVIRKYSTSRSYTVLSGTRSVHFRNTNVLVSDPTWKIAVQKTGYLNEAGRCLVMQAVIQDRTFVLVLLNSAGKNTRVADARRIRKWMEARPKGDVLRTASRM